MSRGTILSEGKNCWRIARAGRVSFLVDGEEYFSALTAACERARRSILIVGWDVHGQVDLQRHGAGQRRSVRLGELLNELTDRRRELEVHVLDWDFAVIYALDREVLPAWRLDWRRHRRVHFALDGEHPVGASHHQKIVVIDDAVAFVGGMDLAPRRWDSRRHLPQDARRVDPSGKPYPPFHDIQMAVDDEAARALGDLVRQRWRTAQGETLNRPPSADPWPDTLPVHVRNIEVAVARTAAKWKEQPAVQEIEALYVDMIGAACRSIYLENQYLTSSVIGEALCGRLREPEGPEIVIVVRQECTGWLEDLTMGVLRSRLVQKLRAADRSGRLGIFCPVADRSRGIGVQVHAKCIIVDDTMLQIGSANLNNRSMGLDSECNVAIDSTGDPDTRAAIRWLRDDLVAEHCGVAPAVVNETFKQSGSLLRTIDAFRGQPKTLVPLDATVEPWIDAMVPDAAVIDPERPVEFDRLLDQIIPEDFVEPLFDTRGRLIVGILGVVVLVAGWRWGAAAGWLEPSHIAAWAEQLQQGVAGYAAGILAFAIASTLLVPVTPLIAAAGLLFDPLVALVLTTAGCLLGATLGYELGRFLWRDAVRRLGGRALNRINRLLTRRGILAVATVRMIPIAPFGVVSLIAGSLRVPYRSWLIGTLVGMTPGIFVIIIFAHHLARIISDPGLDTVLVGIIIAGAACLGAWWLRRMLFTRQSRNPGAVNE
jgi:phospholipase D1/2